MDNLLAGISIHALRGEGDLHSIAQIFSGHGFQSTPSVGRATPCRCGQHRGGAISIHALRGEGDGDREAIPPADYQFQSTPSVGRAT